jgi:hypothetical protein
VKSAIVFSFLVVVDEFDVPGAAGTPGETEAPLVVDADAVLAGAVADQLLQAVAGGYPQVVDALGGVDENEFVISELA